MAGNGAPGLGMFFVIYALVICIAVGCGVGLVVIGLLRRSRLRLGVAILGTGLSGLTLPLVLFLLAYMGHSKGSLLSDSEWFYFNWALGLIATVGVAFITHVLSTYKD